MTNITKEGYEQMQEKVRQKALKKKYPNHISVGGFNYPLHKEAVRIRIKPLSSNDAWKGRRFRSDLYKQYASDLLGLLPKLTLPDPPYKITYEFGFSSKGSDIDNPLKSLGDILQEKYKFNDNQVYEMHIHKKIVKKLGEYISFKIESL